MRNLEMIPVILAIIAGLLNGAYISPINKDSAQNSYIWIVFAIAAYFLLPSLILIYDAFNNLLDIPTKYIFIMIGTGIIYGFGLYLLTKSIGKIGLGIPMALNICFGVLSGSFFSIALAGQLKNKLTTPLMVSYIIFIIAMVIYSIALSIRDRKQNKFWLKGLLLAIGGGALCASQGACLSYFSDYFKNKNQGFVYQLSPWLIILMSCAVVFVMSHWKDVCKVHVTPNKKEIVIKSLLMTLLQVSSFVIYTISNTMTTSYSQIYLWAIFMGSIVISSTVVSYGKHEWAQASVKANLVNALGVVLLFISILLLTVTQL